MLWLRFLAVEVAASNHTSLQRAAIWPVAMVCTLVFVFVCWWGEGSATYEDICQATLKRWSLRSGEVRGFIFNDFLNVAFALADDEFRFPSNAK